VIREMAERQLEVMDVETLRLHYARTLWKWSERLEANLERARQHAGDKRLRVWRAYLAGCAHGFDQYLFQRETCMVTGNRYPHWILLQ